MQRVWSQRTEVVLGEIDREVGQALEGLDTVSEVIKLRLLVQLSYGQRAFFDRRTHQKRSLVVARLAYPFAAARLLTGVDSDELTAQVLEHLQGALEEIQGLLGGAELARLVVPLTGVDPALQNELRASLDPADLAALEAAPTVSGLPADRRAGVGKVIGRSVMSRGLRGLILAVGDRLWVDYLTQMEALRTSIGLEAYGQRDPLVQYKSRAFDMFQALMGDIRSGVASRIFRAQVPAQAQGAQSVPRDVEPEPAKPPPATAGSESEVPRGGKRRRRH
jgi:preprotein translocase subunit SecA